MHGVGIGLCRSHSVGVRSGTGNVFVYVITYGLAMLSHGGAGDVALTGAK